MAYCIPDAPNNLKIQLQRERQTQREEQFQANQKRPRTYLSAKSAAEDDFIGRETPIDNIHEVRFRKATNSGSGHEGFRNLNASGQSRRSLNIISPF